MKSLSFLSTAALALIALSGCSSDDASSVIDPENNAAESVPVSFSTYLGRQSNGTRAGVTGDMTNDKLKSNGFGVFAFYTGLNTYQSTRTSDTPNFMYNTKVSGTTSGNTTSWSYSPVRYWPNPTLNDNDEETSQYVSFFAYAPYTAEPSTTETSGITAFSKNSDAGDPTITYSAAETSDGNQVDLLWGTAGTSAAGAKPTGSSMTVSDNAGKAYDATSEVASGIKVNADFTKQNVGGKIDFLFKHALAKFGGYSANPESGANKNGITVDLMSDEVSGTSAAVDNAKTRVTIKSIKIEAKQAPTTTGGTTSNLYQSGKFNLVTGQWNDCVAGTESATQTLQGATTDGTTTTPASLASDILEPAANVTLTTGTGDNLAWASTMPEGVTVTAKTIYTPEAKSMLIIPGQTPSFTITIDYIVRTLDPLLAKGYTEVEQKIKKDVSFGTALQSNMRYNLAIHLGLTSVKFDASVDPWTDENNASSQSGSGSESGNESVDMPVNVQ